MLSNKKGIDLNPEPRKLKVGVLNTLIGRPVKCLLKATNTATKQIVIH